MEKEVLLKIGLSNNEADIYLSLLRLGPSLVSRIVEKTKLNRTNIYDRLEKLITKGLVSYIIKNNRKYFYAADPQRILNYLKEKEDRLRNEINSVESIIPLLEKVKPSATKETVEVYEGKEGIKTILEDVIKIKRDVLTYGSNGNFSKILKFYFRNYLKRLEKVKIRMKVIFNEDDSKEPFTWKFAEVRYLPKEYRSPTETTIYGDKIAIFILSEEPKAILIKSETVSKAYKKYFEIMWKIAKK